MQLGSGQRETYRDASVLDNWKDNRSVFWTLAGPGTFWLLVFFILPLGLSVRHVLQREGRDQWRSLDHRYDYLTGVTNYIRSVDPLYLTIIWKSIWVSALATALCLVTAYPIAFGICFAPERWKPCFCCSSSCRSGSIF